jgi:redox-sensitive bicupin YhaK (pirin superfamily)
MDREGVTEMGSMEKIDPRDHVVGRMGGVIEAIPHSIGNGFTAKHFSEEMFGGGMDPLLMVDHFVMTGPTFDPHLHAGISAVTAMFEDSKGAFLNRDTLGNNVELRAGDLYWLAAAAGAAHEEKPEDGAYIHALQIFVNLPQRLKNCPARALHVEAGEVPVLEGDGYRIRVVLGRSGDAVGVDDTPQDITMLDGFLEADSSFAHQLPEGQQAWIYAVSGVLSVQCGDEQRIIPAGSATTVDAGDLAEIMLRGSQAVHFTLMAGRPIHEPFVKHGPLVMSSEADVRRTLKNYAEGKFGRVPS